MTTKEKEKFMTDVTSPVELERLHDAVVAIAWNIAAGTGVSKEEATKYLTDIVESNVAEYFEANS